MMSQGAKVSGSSFAITCASSSARIVVAGFLVTLDQRSAKIDVAGIQLDAAAQYVCRFLERTDFRGQVSQQVGCFRIARLSRQQCSGDFLGLGESRRRHGLLNLREIPPRTDRRLQRSQMIGWQHYDFTGLELQFAQEAMALVEIRVQGQGAGKCLARSLCLSGTHLCEREVAMCRIGLRMKASPRG